MLSDAERDDLLLLDEIAKAKGLTGKGKWPAIMTALKGTHPRLNSKVTQKHIEECVKSAKRSKKARADTEEKQRRNHQRCMERRSQKDIR